MRDLPFKGGEFVRNLNISSLYLFLKDDFGENYPAFHLVIKSSSGPKAIC